VKVLELSADTWKVLGLHAQPVLLRSLDLELPETHERIGRGCELLRLLERDAPHTCRSAIDDAWQDIDV
jgi:hypothetical protein